MSNRFWIPTLMATALLLSACGDDDASEPAPEGGDTPAEQSEDAPAETADSTEPAPSDEAPDLDTADPEADTATPPSAGQLDDQAPAGETGSAVGDATSDDTAPEDAMSEEAVPEDVTADDDTLSADPEDVLEDEDAAMAGEVTKSDVDEVISDIDRRFEEAEQELKKQFEEAEKQAPTTDPLPGEEGASAENGMPSERDVTLPDEELDIEPSAPPGKLDGELGKSEVDELIEDAERRFEETQQQLQEQYKELEQQEVETASDTATPTVEEPERN